MRKLCAVLFLAFALAGSAQAADLPLTRVVLFYSGVGYFEHNGQVEGDATVNLSFRVEQINDILKSLVIQDLSGGTVAPVSYAPQDPLAHQLSAYSVNVADNPSLAQLLVRVRGSEVIVEGDVAAKGVVLGTEKQQKPAGQTTVEFDVLNLSTSTGLVQMPLPGIKSIRLTDPKLNSELSGQLAAIASSRDAAKRDLTLHFVGTGKRNVRIGYLLETPVWKTTYRLVSQDGKLFLQGWALVDNTTDNDWKAVQMALVSGRPISFTQNLYEPVYAQRPDVPVSLPGIVRPQVLEGEMRMRDGAADRAAVAEAAKAPMAAPAPAPMLAGPGGFGGGGFAAGRGAANGLALVGTGVTAAATGAQVGELFQYAIAQPVTLGRQQSAMIPIVNMTIDGEKLSVYDERTDAIRPYNAMRLKNNTGLHLMGGPITVFDGGAYAGDALVEDVNKGDERLITYAVDLGVEAKVERSSKPQALSSVKIENGVLIASSRERLETTYTLQNRAGEPRTVLVQVPIMADWKLIEPAKADEETRNYYRFKVAVPAGQSGKLVVAMERPLVETVALLNWDRPDRINFFLTSTVISPQVKAALQEIGKRRAEIASLVGQRQAKETRLKEITEEQNRIRQNMAQLDRASDLYKKYVTKLSEQEDEFDAATAAIKDLRQQEQAKTDELNAYIRGLNLS